MKELREILTAAETTAGPMALATVVSVEGSSYRRPGARMLVTPDGPVAGSVSGGCLEADVIEHARAVIATGEHRLLTYDTRDDDPVFGIGTGCAGLIHILVEKIAPGHSALTLPASWLGRRAPAVLATMLTASGAARAGDRWLFSAEERPGSRAVGEPLLRAAREALASGVSETRVILSDDGPVPVFLEVLNPPLALILCGAGADALPLVRMAKEIGWRVTVADHRPAYAASSRFPLADDVIAARPENLFERLTLDPRTAVVVMTHNYYLDDALLSGFSDAPVAYLGLLGSRQRTERILGNLHASDPVRFAQLQDRLHAPIGLDLGAATPEEIALSIVAEIQAVTANRPGGFLRARNAPMKDVAPRRAHTPGGLRACAIAG